MTTAATLLTLIAHAQQHVAALESLAAGMAAGLRAGMIDAEHPAGQCGVGEPAYRLRFSEPPWWPSRTCACHHGPRCCQEEHKGRPGMTTVATLLTLIAHAQQHVAALESLAAGMTAGLRAGMVDADHLYTLLTTQTRVINAQLDQVATVMEDAKIRIPADEGEGPPLTIAPMFDIFGKR